LICIKAPAGAGCTLISENLTPIQAPAEAREDPMLAPSNARKSWSVMQAVANWWSNRTTRNSAIAELTCAGADQVERIAKDVGMSGAELGTLVSRGPEAANELLRRMAELDLDRAEVSRCEPRTFQDLQRVCTMCESKRRCRRDLERDPAAPGWQDYCPNAATLKALDAMPWLTRREW
jgi:hypothetical protein